jgi:hypothetical protein
LALCSLENKDARARFGILKGLHSARRGRDSVTTLRRISQNGKQPEQTARPGHARGERSPPARERPEHERRKEARTSRSSRRARLDNRALPHLGLRRAPKGHHRERPKGPLPQNGIVRVPNASAGTDPCMAGSDSSSSLQKQLLEGVKGGQTSGGIRERPSNQCSTG